MAHSRARRILLISVGLAAAVAVLAWVLTSIRARLKPLVPQASAPELVASSESVRGTLASSEETSPYWLRFLDQDGHPVSGAIVTTSTAWGTVQEVRSDERGGAVVHMPRVPKSSPEDHLLKVQHRGHALQYVFLDPGHESFENAKDVLLRPGAALELVLSTSEAARNADLRVRVAAEATYATEVDDPDGPVPVALHAFPFTAWEQRIDPTGRVVFEDLPTEVPVETSLLVDESIRWRSYPSRRLTSGEHARMEISVEGFCDLLGTLLDEKGRPASGRRIELYPAHDLGDAAYVRRSDRCSDSATTDSQGRFRFEKLLPGSYFACPVAGPERAKDAIAPLAERLEIPAGESSRTWTLHEREGVYIQGAICDPQSQPAQNLIVRARSKSGRGRIQVTTDERGRFSLGPVIAETFVLEARQGDLRLPPTEVRGGDLNLILRLRPVDAR